MEGVSNISNVYLLLKKNSLYLHGSRYLANCYAGFTLEFIIHYKVCCNVKSGNVVGFYTGR